jgi:hypothetical protein
MASLVASSTSLCCRSGLACTACCPLLAVAKAAAAAGWGAAGPAAAVILRRSLICWANSRGPESLLAEAARREARRGYIATLRAAAMCRAE